MGNHKALLTTGMVLLLIMALAAPHANAQVVYGQPTAGNLRLTYTSWSVEGDNIENYDISQLLIPLTGFVPLSEDFEMKFFVANSSNSADFGSSENKLSGLSDARLQFNRSFSNDRMIVSIGFNLPSGKKGLTSEEQTVTQSLSTNYLSFPIRRLGEGFDINALFGIATSTENSRFGASLFYEITGGYDAFDALGEYNPGNMLSLNGTADLRNGNTLYRASLTYTAFTADQEAGTDVFSQADEIGINLGLTQSNEMYTLGFNARMFFRGNNQIFSAAGADALGNELKLYGDEFAASGFISWLLLKDLTASPAIELRVIGENEQGSGDATIFTIGSGFGYRLSDDVNWESGIRLSTGSAQGGDVSLSGFQLYTGIAAAL